MPLLVTYRGRPVKRRRRTASGLSLTYFAPRVGHPGQQLIVSQRDWNTYSRVQFFNRHAIPDVRALASGYEVTEQVEITLNRMGDTQ